MKTNVKFFFTIFFLFTCSYSFADSKILYLDIDYILNNSNIGKKRIENINLKRKDIEDKLIQIESEIKNEEQQILSQKNVISDEEFEKKISNLRNKIKKYNEDKTQQLNNINKETIETSQLLLNKLKPILEDYSKKNNISLLLLKENIVIGKQELDITNDILNKFNNQINDTEIN